MPIRLAATSRRDFLRRAVLAGAAFTLAPQAFAATRKTDADLFALLADTHLAGDLKRVERNVNMADHFTTVRGELLALPRSPAGMFMVGDLALNNGQPDDYASLLDLLAPLRASGLTAHLALGNHDQRQNFQAACAPERDRQSPVGVDRHVALVKSRRANWFVLDSLEKTLQVPGLLGEEQLAWLAKALDANSSKPALILVHHNPQTPGTVAGLKDTEKLYEIMRPRKQVKAYIFGHTHDWKVAQDSSGIHLINLPPVAYVFKEGNPSGWVQATLERGGMNLELRCVNPAHAQHGSRHELKWRSKA